MMPKDRLSRLKVAAGAGILCALAFIIAPNDRVVAAAADPAQLLVSMAQARFGALTDAELAVLRAAPARELVWTSKSKDPDDPLNNVAKAESWGKERTIRAELLAWLVSDAEASKLVHPSGVGIGG